MRVKRTKFLSLFITVQVQCLDENDDDDDDDDNSIIAIITMTITTIIGAVKLIIICDD